MKCRMGEKKEHRKLRMSKKELLKVKKDLLRPHQGQKGLLTRALRSAEYSTFKSCSQNPTQIADQLRQVLEFEKNKAAEQCRAEAAEENAQENKELVQRLREQVRALVG